jgi:3-hydroxyacyl-[acyl-carrier-protein] dehydratase
MQAEEYEALARASRKRALFQQDPACTLDLDRSAVERLLPHRDPFLFVDHITSADLANRTIVGCRRLDPGDPVFRGHFPGEPIYPGVLQLETMGQVGLCLFALLRNGRTTVRPEDRPRAVRGLKIHHAVFLEPVRAGDDLVVLAQEMESDDFTAVCAGQLYVGDTICCFSIMEVYFVDA